MKEPGSLGEAVRQRRLELGLTQEELAERIGEGVRQSDVSRLERGKVALPRAERMARLAAALGLPLAELLARSGWGGAEAAFPAETEPALPNAPPAVLVVDDEPAVAEALAGLLADAGHRVALAHDGAAALAAIDRAPPALVVADAALPGLGAPALVAELRRRRPPVPAILTGVGPPDPDLPSVPYVAKPLDAERVLAAVAAALAGGTAPP